ncbi:L-seryl-tRNA(Sec) selenium transferase [Clostridium amylolyticum]|uniref:L-seryl-tRNA(Sec) selenium transferase n=1 Tax=Clostridium amylolyticum TaxID=1121298 RepID=A0A1M6BGW1_9CLOT|nr:L-seryl-tRNA(Sec) selenium transferase [Clostridium amylolyticum]SHI47917.1 L-seryl-tRNA(Sec) selenium transferase [Clostridium amylolyticum]
MGKELLRKLPKVDILLQHSKVEEAFENNSRVLVIEAVREALEDTRKNILEGNIQEFTIEDIINTFNDILDKNNKPKLRKVINAAGIVIHTNLGRSLLCDKAVNQVEDIIKNYNNLEYDIDKGARGSRYSHIEDIIKEITGAEAALVVNNNAAAVMLVLNTLCEEKEAIVSRGQLVEIGGSFRVPEVMKFSKAKLVEVGTTNRTHLYDYENNITENTGVLLKVHTSNFKILGFTEDVSAEELTKLGEKYDVPVVEDIGSGVLINLQSYGLSYEPTVQESVKKGIDVITFSGDKMLGGPQAGIIIGKKKYIDKIKKNQLTRALRVDKMTLAALEATLKCYLDEETAIKEIPTLNMMLTPPEEIKKKAQLLKRKLSTAPKHFSFHIEEDYSMVGGGSMPEEKLKTYVVKVKSSKFSAKELEGELRNYETPIISRISNDEIYLDLRTIFKEDFEIILNALKALGE